LFPSAVEQPDERIEDSEEFCCLRVVVRVDLERAGVDTQLDRQFATHGKDGQMLAREPAVQVPAFPFEVAGVALAGEGPDTQLLTVEFATEGVCELPCR
jgi:hypothetical protein